MAANNVRANGNTGLAQPEVYYVGHLQGELNGQTTGGGYFVTNADLTLVNPVGTLAAVGDLRDIDKNGIVMNADGVLIRNSIVAGLTLRNITIPAKGHAGEGSSMLVQRVNSRFIGSAAHTGAAGFEAVPMLVVNSSWSEPETGKNQSHELLENAETETNSLLDQQLSDPIPFRSTTGAFDSYFANYSEEAENETVDSLATSGRSGLVKRLL